MKITRRGSTADHGESSIEMKTPSFVWRKSDSCILIRQLNVKDFSTTSHHSYTISLNLFEINNLIQVLADAAIADTVLFEKSLESSLKALIRIQAVAAGIKT